MNTECEWNETVASESGRDPMRMSRNGKIARLPREVRDEVNRRLEAHQSGSKIVDWLNAEPAVKDVLEREFGGKPISPDDNPKGFVTLIGNAVALSPGFAGSFSQPVANQGPVGPVKVNQSKK